MKLFDLTGRVALVTGGNGGLGLAMAQGMASCGADIVLSGRNAEKAKAALDTLTEYGHRNLPPTPDRRIRKLRVSRTGAAFNRAGTYP